MSTITDDNFLCQSSSTVLPPEKSIRRSFSVCVTALIGGKTSRVVVSGRNAWALIKLIEAAAKGCSTQETPAPRWSGYIHRLRQLGFDVETRQQPNIGLFRGRHARYFLTTRIVEKSPLVAQPRGNGRKRVRRRSGGAPGKGGTTAAEKTRRCPR